MAFRKHPDFHGLVFLGCPSNGLHVSHTALNMAGLAANSAYVGLLTMPQGVEGPYIETNRNALVELAQYFEYGKVAGILWIDADMAFPSDALLRLWAHDLPIVGCNYRARKPPYKMAGEYLDGDDAHAAEGGLHKMMRLPGGFILVRMPVYEKIGYPWYEPPLHRNDDRDDYKFCRKAREAGFDIWCDNDLTRQIIHKGGQDIGWFKPEQLVRVTGGTHRADAGVQFTEDDIPGLDVAADRMEYRV